MAIDAGISFRDFLAGVRAAHPHRAAIDDAELVYNSEHDFLHGKVPASNGTWQQVAMLLVARALQLQRAILDGVTIG